MECAYSEEITEVTRKALADLGYPYNFNSKFGAFTYFPRHTKKLPSMETPEYTIDVGYTDLVCRATIVPKDELNIETLETLGKFINRMNFPELHVSGRYFFNIDDGETGFESYCNIIADSQVRNAISAPLDWLDIYIPAISGILHDGLSADAAVEKIEGVIP